MVPTSSAEPRGLPSQVDPTQGAGLGRLPAPAAHVPRCQHPSVRVCVGEDPLPTQEPGTPLVHGLCVALACVTRGSVPPLVSCACASPLHYCTPPWQATTVPQQPHGPGGSLPHGHGACVASNSRDAGGVQRAGNPQLPRTGRVRAYRPPPTPLPRVHGVVSFLRVHNCLLSRLPVPCTHPSPIPHQHIDSAPVGLPHGRLHKAFSWQPWYGDH